MIRSSTLSVTSQYRQLRRGGMKMPHWMLITLFTAGTSLGVALGSLMCCSPIRARRLIAWWSRADEWSAPRPEAGSRGWELEMRLAGLGLAVMFGFMLRAALIGLFHATQVSQPTPQGFSTVMPSSGTNWTSFIAVPIFLAAGLWHLLKPYAVAERVARSWPGRTLHESSRVRQIFVVRMFGVILLLVGSYLLWRTHW